MMSFRGTGLRDFMLPQGLVWLLETLAEAKGRQQLFEQQAPQILKTLREMALIESTESSNRIEGVTVPHQRLRPLILGGAAPRDRPEEEIVGYRRALDWIHTRWPDIELTPEVCLRLHALAQGGTSGDAGAWKTKPNDVVEVYPDGHRTVRLVTVAPELVPSAMEELFASYRDCLEDRQVTPLLAAAALILDFTCIHPFRDGNGRVSRLLTLLAIYRQGFEVGRYISLERLVEQSKGEYYDALQASSRDWHSGRHDVFPWLGYLLSILRLAYRELEERAGRTRAVRGSKTQLIEGALERMIGPFGIADVEKDCPSVGRDMIRRVMNRWRKEGRLEILGRGRDARWKRRELSDRPH